MTGLTRQQAAEAVAALFGTSARQTHESTTYDPWEVIDRDGKKMALRFRQQHQGYHAGWPPPDSCDIGPL